MLPSFSMRFTAFFSPVFSVFSSEFRLNGNELNFFKRKEKNFLFRGRLSFKVVYSLHFLKLFLSFMDFLEPGLFQSKVDFFVLHESESAKVVRLIAFEIPPPMKCEETAKEKGGK